MRQQNSTIRNPQSKILIGLAIGTCLVAATGLPAQPPSMERPAGGGYGAGAVGEATFQIDPETGSLIVIADEETDQQIQQVIKQLDRPVPQVLIKVLFLEVTHGDDLDLGVEASFRYGGRTREVETGEVDPNTGEPLTEEVLQFQDTLETLFGLSAANEGAFWHIVKEDFDMTVHALAKVAKLEVLSRPSILARNNETAIITLGQEVPFIRNSRVTQDGQIINTIEYEDIGIILEVTPHISTNGVVEMTVAPEISTLSGETVPVSEGIEAPVIAKRAAETSCVVPDGMTVVIGGLMEDNETEAVRKVPILGDIPWLGTAFRRTIKSKTKTELLIFLTPHVVQRTSGLEPLSIAESQKADLAGVAFTQDELDKHLEGQEKLIRRHEEKVEPQKPLRRAKMWLWPAVQIFK
ncbi:hypothetical protein AMJ85_05055 [candidate division BRC1 bacterium SM23_51]|nr:MAG: hypothetical protein AMJ85_05055 [candidate division BRC1 bacterium SM23_51]